MYFLRGLTPHTPSLVLIRIKTTMNNSNNYLEPQLHIRTRDGHPGRADGARQKLRRKLLVSKDDIFTTSDAANLCARITFAALLKCFSPLEHFFLLLDILVTYTAYVNT